MDILTTFMKLRFMFNYQHKTRFLSQNLSTKRLIYHKWICGVSRR
jgi:hypothetical protein